jgi:predicted ATP-grasp superfamily ATP-dependent carboligase
VVAPKREASIDARRLRSPENPAVVIGLDCLQGLQSARLLAARGIPVVGVAKDPKHYACRSRACDQVLIADTGGDGLIDRLLEVGPTFAAKPVLFPCQDKNVIVVSRHRALLAEWYHVVLPPDEVVELMLDKSTFYAYAQAGGFPLTPTYVLQERADAERAASELTFPAIVKPSVRLREWSKHTKEKAFIVSNAAELLQEYERLRAWASVLIVQELIQGPDRNHFTCNAYFGKSGEPLVVFTTQKLRQWPPATGQACLSREARNDEVAAETVRLFRSVDYRGLAYLEMKQDERSGRHFIVEPNIGRPTGRAATAEAAGVELLYTMYCDALDLPLPAARTQHYRGVIWMHVMRDIEAALYHLVRRELTIREWWGSVRGKRTYAIMSWRDPLPFLTAIYQAIPDVLAARRRS